MRWNDFRGHHMTPTLYYISKKIFRDKTIV